MAKKKLDIPVHVQNAAQWHLDVACYWYIKRDYRKYNRHLAIANRLRYG